MDKKFNFAGEKDYLKYLSHEKVISDEIINHSRSMISIINRDYIYEKVNATFCNAHHSHLEVIVGNHLSISGEKRSLKMKLRKILIYAFQVRL